MKPIGRVLHISSSRNIVVKSVIKIISDPKGEKVYDKKGRHIGEIIDVIGPLRKPYILIKPIISLEEAEKLVGKRLYIRE